MPTNKEIKAGDRVEISPACDLWMRGARFGTVRKVESDGDFVLVKMDHPKVRKLQRFFVGAVSKV